MSKRRNVNPAVVVAAIAILVWKLGPLAVEFGLRSLSEAQKDSIADGLPAQLGARVDEAWERAHRSNNLDPGPLPHDDFARLGAVEVHYIVADGVARKSGEAPKPARIKVDASGLSNVSVLILGSKRGVVWDLSDVDMTLVRAVVVSSVYGDSSVRGLSDGARAYFVDDEDAWRFYAANLVPECAYQTWVAQYLCDPSYGFFEDETFPFDAVEAVSEAFFGRPLDSYQAIGDARQAELPGVRLTAEFRRDLGRQRAAIEARLEFQRALNRKADDHARADRDQRLEDLAKAQEDRLPMELAQSSDQEAMIYAVTATGARRLRLFYVTQEALFGSSRHSEYVGFYVPLKVCVLTRKPLVLVLTSDDPALWHVRLGPGTDLRGVLVLSKSTAIVDGLPKDMPITYHAQDASDMVPFGHLQNAKDRAALEAYLIGLLGERPLETRNLTRENAYHEVIADAPYLASRKRPSRSPLDRPEIPALCRGVEG